MRLSLQHLRAKTVKLGVCQDLVMALCFPVDGGRIVRRSFSKAWTWAGWAAAHKRFLQWVGKQ